MSYPRYLTSEETKLLKENQVDDEQVIIILKEAKQLFMTYKEWDIGRDEQTGACDIFNQPVEPYDLQARKWTVRGAILSRMARGRKNVDAAIGAMSENIPDQLGYSLQDFNFGDATFGGVLGLFDDTIKKLSNDYFLAMAKREDNVPTLFSMEIKCADFSKNKLKYPEKGDIVRMEFPDEEFLKMKIVYCFFKGEKFGSLIYNGVAVANEQIINSEYKWNGYALGGF